MMKTAFSTLGCPDWQWGEIFSAATDLGMDGIEIRGIEKRLFAPETRPFREKYRAQTMADLKRAGLELPMLSSGAVLGVGDAEENLAEVRAYIDFAGEIGAGAVRVMITDRPEPTDFIDVKKAKGLYRMLCEYAQERGSVQVLIETNSVLADTARMADFLDGIDSPAAGVLWDIHHPFRFYGESPSDSCKNIGKKVKYLHVKDSAKSGDGVEYRMMGYGDVPVFDALRCMAELGYDGFVTLEWVKRWCPQLEEPGIVFAHFATYMKVLLSQIAQP